MGEPYAMDEPRGYAASIDGQISLRTASYREEAAMVNALVLFDGWSAYETGAWNDQVITMLWGRFFEQAKAQGKEVAIVEVQCVPLPSIGAAGGFCPECGAPGYGGPKPSPEERRERSQAKRLGFDQPGESWSDRRRGSTRDDGREGRSFPHTHGGEGFNHVD